MSNLPTVDRITQKIDADTTSGMMMSKSGPSVPTFRSMNEVMEFAKLMAVADIGIRKHLRANVGACLAVCLQAQRWEMDPFMVANKSYLVNDQIAYESQLISAVINVRAPIEGRLKTRFVGSGPTRQCIASATFKGDSEPTEVESPEIQHITPKNSPLWKTDPDQQLAYYTRRLWARRETPEIMLGVYDIDELAAAAAAAVAKDITPPRPTRSDFKALPTEADEREADRLAKQFAETGTAEGFDPEAGEIERLSEAKLIAAIEDTKHVAALLDWWGLENVHESVAFLEDANPDAWGRVCDAFEARRDALAEAA